MLARRTRRLALFEGAIAGTLFGTAAIFIRLLYALDIFSIAFGRLTIASAALIVTVLAFRLRFNFSLLKANIERILMLGVLLGMHFIFFVSSIKDTTILNATVLVNTAPILTMIISALHFGVKPSRSALFGLMVSMLGVFLITYGDFSYVLITHLRGDVEAVLAAFAEALYLNYGREVRSKVPLLSTMIPIYLVAALAVGFFSAVAGSFPNFPVDLDLILLLLALGIFPTAIAHTLYFSSLSNLKSFETATLALLEPIIATLLGAALFLEIPAPIFALGAFLVLFGIILIVKT